MSAGEQTSDQHFMALALEEGAKGIGLTAPNPSVGAVLVRDGEVLGKGFHSRAGQPHAEIEALADCRRRGNDPQGSDIFITLEPCSTSGRTPPCTQAILENGIRRVIWAVDDPNPHHQGGAYEVLSQAGIEITTGVLEKEAEFLHRAFFKVQRTGLPWIIVKTAMSLDGRITRPPGEGQWLTGAKARTDVQVLRGEVDAILTSGATATKRQSASRLSRTIEVRRSNLPVSCIPPGRKPDCRKEPIFSLRTKEGRPNFLLETGRLTSGNSWVKVSNPS